MPYSIKEIIDIAIGIEETGFEFYSLSAKKFSDPIISDIFSFLSNEELAHKKLFQSFNRADDTKGIFTDEYYSYLRAIGGGRIFEKQQTTIDQVVAGITTPLEAIKHAFGTEKDSILFYSEMKILYQKNPETLSLIDKIIGEERKHVATLLDLLEKIRITS